MAVKVSARPRVSLAASPPIGFAAAFLLPANPERPRARPLSRRTTARSTRPPGIARTANPSRAGDRVTHHQPKHLPRLPELKDPVVRAEMRRRDPRHRRTWVIVTDGERALQRRVTDSFTDVTLVLDFLHAAEKLWKVAHARYPERSREAETFVYERAERIVDGQVAQVIECLRLIVTKRLGRSPRALSRARLSREQACRCPTSVLLACCRIVCTEQPQSRPERRRAAPLRAQGLAGGSPSAGERPLSLGRARISAPASTWLRSRQTPHRSCWRPWPARSVRDSMQHTAAGSATGRSGLAEQFGRGAITRAARTPRSRVTRGCSRPPAALICLV